MEQALLGRLDPLVNLVNLVNLGHQGQRGQRVLLEKPVQQV